MEMKWHPASEDEWPEQDGNYLVSLAAARPNNSEQIFSTEGDYFVELAKWKSDMTGGAFFLPGASVSITAGNVFRIAAWMELPEAYREEI